MLPRQQTLPLQMAMHEATLRALEVEEAEEIEFEREIALTDAIVEPYCEVKDVAENVLIDLLVKDGTL